MYINVRIFHEPPMNKSKRYNEWSRIYTYSTEDNTISIGDKVSIPDLDTKRNPNDIALAVVVGINVTPPYGKQIKSIVGRWVNV